MEGKIQYRAYPVELRVDQDGDDPPKLEGYAAVFDSPSEDMGFTEIIRPGAFKKTLKEGDVRALWNHNPDYVLGRTKSGTLTLAEDDKGLSMQAIPPATTWAKDLLTTIERGDVDQMSFGFRTVRDKWDHDNNKRELIELELFDVSPVTFPAYTQTSVQVRALQEAGIDDEGLDRIFTRLQRDLDLTDSDRDLIKATQEILSSCLESAPDPAVHPDGDDKPGSIAHLSILHRRLEIAQRQ